MRLSLPFESPWNVVQAPDGQLAAILPGAAANLPEMVVTYGPIAIKPDEPRRWIEQTSRRDVPPNARVELGRRIDGKTATDWPLTLVEAKLYAGTGELLEVRLCAFYTFMEHAAVAIVRAKDDARFEAHGAAIAAILAQGRPDWRGEPACLADAWDLEIKQSRPRAAQRSAERAALAELAQLHDAAALGAALADVERTLAAAPTAMGHVRHGQLLIDLGRVPEAADAFAAAVAADPALAVAHYYRGVALGSLGKTTEAIAAWDQSIALAPDRVDSHYNAAQARFLLKDYAGALAEFQTVGKLDPADFMVHRKIIQCLYALGRYDEGAAARGAFRRAWAASADPRAPFVTEFVFDQFEGDGFWVHAVETLRPADPGIYTMIAFRAMHLHDGHEHPLPAAVLVETSDQAKSAGTPFVLAVTANGVYRVLGATDELPPYPQLKQDVLTQLGHALRTPQQ